MTCLAFARRWLIHHNGSAFGRACDFVTVATRNISMRTLQRKRSPFVVVKICRPPLHQIVAVRTVRRVFAHRKLPTMHIRMATRTLFRSSSNIDIRHRRFHLGGNVTLRTRNAPVRTL